MFEASGKKVTFLCGGTQSSGSTLLSWCFLQRKDMDGVLDARFDMMPPSPEVKTEYLWVKMTVACFGLTEAVDFWRDEGRDVRPILLVRDARAVFNSLLVKEYGRNGTTADDPPIRLRLRRFLHDWEMARREGWTIIKFEDLIAAPRQTLERACTQLGLPWDEGMMNWPKSVEQITDGRHGNETFVRSRAGGLEASIRPIPLEVGRIPQEDLVWLESEFAAFNHVHGYPEHVARTERQPPGRAVPSYEVTRRYWRKHHGVKEAWRKLASRIGMAGVHGRD